MTLAGDEVRRLVEGAMHDGGTHPDPAAGNRFAIRELKGILAELADKVAALQGYADAAGKVDAVEIICRDLATRIEALEYQVKHFPYRVLPPVQQEPFTVTED